jgi:hypothetical protein
VIVELGHKLVAAVATDNAGNARHSRELIKEVYPHIVNFPVTAVFGRRFSWFQQTGGHCCVGALSYPGQANSDMRCSCHRLLQAHDARNAAVPCSGPTSWATAGRGPSSRLPSAL